MVESVTVVECRGTTVRRRDSTLLGPIDLRIPAGRFCGVAGPNGAGKSTLLRAIAGLESITDGTLDVSWDDDSGRVGLLFQQHDFVPELPFTVEDVVSFGRAGRVAAGPVRSRDDRAAVAKAIERFGLEGMRRRLYRELSGGERQKVQLARLMAQDAKLLLLDEPSAGLDLDWQERLTALVAELHRETGSTVVMVTHEVDRLPACCDVVLLLREGRAVAIGPPGEVLTREILSDLYACRMEVAERNGRYFAHSHGPLGGGSA